MPFLHSTFVRECATEVLMTKGMSLEKQNLLCAARPTHAHTKYKKPQITFWIQKKETFWLLHTLWVKSKINRCADTDYITVTDTIISSGLRQSAKSIIQQQTTFQSQMVFQRFLSLKQHLRFMERFPTISLTFCSQDMMSYVKLFYF